LPQNGAQRAAGEISIAVNRDDDDKRSFDGTPEVVMTPSDVNDFAASALEKHGPRAGR
jgi:hypothetical protein